MVLLVFCGWRVMSMGVEMLPTITSNEAIVTLSTEKDMTKEESYAVAENVIDALLAVDNVEEVGVTTDSRVAGMDVGQLGLPKTITDLLNAANGYGKYKINVKLNEELSSSKIDAACKAMEEAVAGVADCTATVQQYGMTDEFDMVAMQTTRNQYLGGDTSMSCSEQTQREIDRKVVELVRTEHERAHSLLTEHRALLDQLAQVLYEKETITGEEFMRILHAAQKEEEHHA